MSKKTITLSIALIGILLLSTLFYSRSVRSHSSSMDPSMIEPDDMI